MEPGLGKSACVLGAVKILLRQKLINRVLIIAPLRVCYSVWPEEIKKWADFNSLRYEILHGDKKDYAVQRDADIYIINPDGLEWLLTKHIVQLAPDMLVIDESTLIKHSRTKRFKLLKPFFPTFRRRVILTGTPVPNGYLDLFSQIYALDCGNALGRYVTHFRMQFFYQTGYGGYTWLLRPGAEKLIEEKIKDLVLRLDAKDYIEMPEVVNNIIRIELPAAARKIYEALEDEMIATLKDDAVVTVASAGALSIKCRQIANGGIYADSEDGGLRYAQNVHEAKTEAAVDLVNELSGQPVLIMYEFEHDRDRLLKAFGKNTPYIGGGVSPLRSQEIVNDWNAGKVPVLLGHPAAMGHGLNLQHAGNHIVWYGLTYDMEIYEQTIRRIRRQGSKHASVFVHHIIARATVDEAIMRALKKKGRVQDNFLAALREYAKERR